jgi:hypothetical protein
VTRESGAPRSAALTIVTARQDQRQTTSAAPYFGGHRGPLPLSDLEVYAHRFADCGTGVDGMSDAELAELLGSVLRRIGDSLGFLLRGAA